MKRTENKIKIKIKLSGSNIRKTVNLRAVSVGYFTVRNSLL
jgi:hypothetical protein